MKNSENDAIAIANKLNITCKDDQTFNNILDNMNLGGKNFEQRKIALKTFRMAILKHKQGKKREFFVDEIAA